MVPNNPKSLKSGIFSSLTNLEVLVVEERYSLNVPDDAFIGLNNLKCLDYILDNKTKQKNGYSEPLVGQHLASGIVV